MQTGYIDYIDYIWRHDPNYNTVDLYGEYMFDMFDIMFAQRFNLPNGGVW
jgi:hypothetical protein